ncbi:uncharacterized protein [Dermacentor andersoni]|uniref:uncharacterized protein n=1 Tax=Dermacentor andersoni TaxID=34620 RepID=UPI003B3B21BC
MATERKKINFTEEERGILIDLVTRESNVLENKRTDAVSLSEKKKKWQQIEEQFNSKNGVHPRTENQLRKCWDNLKEKWRRAKATDTKELFRTGGGKAADSVLTEELQRVGAVASHMSIRIDNAFDSDRARHDVPTSEATAVVTALLSSMQPAAIPEGDGSEFADHHANQDDPIWELEPLSPLNADTSCTETECLGEPEASQAPQVPVSQQSVNRPTRPLPPLVRKRGSTARTSQLDKEIHARLEAVAEERVNRRKEHLLRMKIARAERKELKAINAQKLQNAEAKAALLTLKMQLLKKQLE